MTGSFLLMPPSVLPRQMRTGDDALMQIPDQLRRQFRGEITGLTTTPPAVTPAPDDLDLRAMAAAALNYLRGNPDPARDYECKFSLGPLGIPAHVKGVRN